MRKLRHWGHIISPLSHIRLWTRPPGSRLKCFSKYTVHRVPGTQKLLNRFLLYFATELPPNCSSIQKGQSSVSWGKNHRITIHMPLVYARDFADIFLFNHQRLLHAKSCYPHWMYGKAMGLKGQDSSKANWGTGVKIQVCLTLSPHYNGKPL